MVLRHKTKNYFPARVKKNAANSFAKMGLEQQTFFEGYCIRGPFCRSGLKTTLQPEKWRSDYTRGTPQFKVVYNPIYI